MHATCSKIQIITVFIFLGWIGLYSKSIGPSDDVVVESVEALWSGGSHAAFSDLIWFQEAFYCTFREGESHASPGGTIRILRSKDGIEWETAAILEESGRDLRDPQFSIGEDGRLVVSGASTTYESRPSGSHRLDQFQSFVSFSDDGISWSYPERVGDEGVWMWRLTWNGDKVYSVGYRWPESIQLYESDDALNFSPVGSPMLSENSPNETTLRFNDQGSLLALVRREGVQLESGGYSRDPAFLGRSEPPYTEWEWQDTGVYLGGPEFLQLPDGRWIVGARTRMGPARMSLLELDTETGELKLLEHLPSGGDCGYPGMVWHDGALWVSYYSTHEGASKIFLAKVLLPAKESEGPPLAPVPVGTNRRPVPDFGVMFNEDGDFSFTDPDPEMSERNLRAMFRGLEDTPVRTLVHSVATGSDILLYPSEVGSSFGWRESAGEKKAPWDQRMPIIRANVEAGMDPLQIAAEEAAAMGMYFVPSLRMNDAHFVHDPSNNVLTGAFWLENQNRFTIGQSPVEHEPFGRLLDYTHEEVREHRLAVIREVIDRYGEWMHGLQLDFMRIPILFPPGGVEEGSALLTEMIADVRESLDEAGEKHGHYFSLQVRVPPSLRNCLWAGIDLATWLDRGYVDVVIPSPAMTIAPDLPVAEFVEIATPQGATVYPAIFNRNQFSWPFVVDPKEGDYTLAGQRLTLVEVVRGSVENYRFQGAAGVELYNFNLPLTELSAEILFAVEDPMNGPRVYSVTPSHWNDREDAYEYRKQVPVALNHEEPVQLELIVGENLDSEMTVPASLRLGLSGLKKVYDFELNIQINGRIVHSGSLLDFALPVEGPIGSRGRKLHPLPASVYVQLSLPEDCPLKQGKNEIRFVRSGALRGEIDLVEAGIAVFSEH
tara:strand:+ start:13646 stop:16306 length:2661 start_codon:yes stop_codon:yes gene_type:complete